jgi:sugar phosphate isomerase/epimerase
MPKRISRRDILAAGAAMGLTTGNAGAAPESSSSRSVSSSSFLSQWSPPLDRKRNLTSGPTPFRLASWSSVTTLDYPKGGISITAMVKRVHDAGYTAAVSAPGRMNRSPWLDAPESEIRELKEALKTYDVAFVDMHANANNIHPDLSERQKENRWTILECEAAERIGCPHVTTHTGSCAPSAISMHPDNWTWDTWKLSVKVMKQLLKDTAGMKVALVIEPDNMATINCPRAHKRLIEDVGDPRLKVCLEPVNMMNIGYYYRSTELFEEAFDLLGEHIAIAHAKDSLILPDKMSMYLTEVPPGEGVLDYETYLVGLSRLKYPRALLIEHMADDKYATAKRFIEETAKRVGVKIYGRN